MGTILCYRAVLEGNAANPQIAVLKLEQTGRFAVIGGLLVSGNQPLGLAVGCLPLCPPEEDKL